MSFCIECFKDVHIRNLFEGQGRKGNCGFCPAKNVLTFDMSPASNSIADMMIGLTEIYSVSDSPRSKPLKEALRDDWDIFHVGAETIQTLVVKLCEPIYSSNDDIFRKNVAIPQLNDTVFLDKYGIVKGRNWSDFSESIKHKNRFHNEMFNAKAFESFLTILAESCPTDSNLYRARIAPTEIGFTIHEMGAPPPKKRNAGRINPEGIGILYLALDEKTALSEVRANTFDYVTIGKFKLKRNLTKPNLKIVNLSGIEETSPFRYGEGDDLAKYAANREVLKEIAGEIAEPLRRSDSPLEYLPTQFISEFIKSQGYNGVKYASTLCEGGYNLAVFDEKLFECVDVKTVEVRKIEYETKPGI